MKALETGRDGLELIELGPDAAAEYHAPVQRNAVHLTRLGDYQDEVTRVRGRRGIRHVPPLPPRVGATACG
jgi:hypothetical protein